MTKRRLLLLAALLILSGCGSQVTPSGLPRPTGSASSTTRPGPTPSMSLLPSATVSAPTSVTDWGPLAVISDPNLDTLDAGLGPGELRISDRCVTLHLPDDGLDATLVWRREQTVWQGRDGSIVFTDPRRGRLVLHAGDVVLLGGSSLAVPGASDQGAGQPVWVVKADAECPSNTWLVQSVVPS